jgi:predicted nucleic acid-binding protein
MKKFMVSVIMSLCLLLTMSIVGAAPNPEAESLQKQVVIIPFINSTEETKDYIAETVKTKFTEQFSNVKYQTVSQETVQASLVANKFDASNMELPEKDLMIKLANETNADYVVSMEIVQFINSRHASFFSTSAKSEVKLRYKVYSKSTNQVTTFQTVGKGNNKVTSIGVPGIGEAMRRGLTEAMDEGFIKIEKL